MRKTVFTNYKFKKNTHIAFVVVASVFLLISIIGILNRLAEGKNELENYLANIILLPISAFFLIRSGIILKRKLKTAMIPWGIVKILVETAMAICYFGFGVWFLIDGLKKQAITQIIVAVIISAITVCVAYYFAPNITTPFALLYNNPEKSKALLINLVMNGKMLFYVTDIIANQSIPYIDRNRHSEYGTDNIVFLYDSIDLADKELKSLNLNGKIPAYAIKTVSKKNRKEWLQSVFDKGFKRFRYITAYGGVNIDFEELPLNKNNDPINSISDCCLVQNYIEMQQSLRYTHIKAVGDYLGKTASALQYASEMAKKSVEMFSSSAFYTLVMPEEAADGILKISEAVIDICAEKGINYCDFFNKINLKAVCSNGISTPYCDKDNQGEQFVISFTSYKKAEEFLYDVKNILASWEAETPREVKMECIDYWYRLKEITACEICVMTGEEIAKHMLNTRSKFVSINFEQQLSLNTIEGYIADKDVKAIEPNCLNAVEKTIAMQFKNVKPQKKAEQLM